MNVHPSVNSAMSSTTHPNIPAAPSLAAPCLDELDGLCCLRQPEHPTFHHQPPPPPTAAHTSQNMLLPMPTGPPSSPPPLIHSRSPYARIPLPDNLPNLEGEPSIDTILHEPPSSPRPKWDVRTHPNDFVREQSGRPFQLQLGDEHQHLTDQWHKAPASTLCLDQLFIYTDIWPDEPIVVQPSDSTSSFVTAYDIFVAVHEAIGCARIGDDTPRSLLLGACRLSGDHQRQNWRAGPARRIDPSWSQWEWGGLERIWGKGWRLILR